MINRAIIILAVCTFGGLTVPSVFETYLKKERGSVETIDEASPVVEAAAPPTASFDRSVVLEADASGHFRTDARLNGMRNDVLIDTGATQVAITASIARQIGIHPGPGDWTVAVQTANGAARAAPARIDRLEIGPITVRDVEALILEDGRLGMTLLGMSFLSELSRYSVEDGRLTLVR
ncbi:TIGR02281 family clan AA aspartic protease [Fulvimarina sp. 2208YS6-2-32]|uniref:TIGR02281 family clan AA aspartic protease n=1 Tax=Fulvimarina uroteuthidis TaxID=3098149 RepID=A0ABU5I078_9HYPH|nr:TIGR02281 family clan AA aspartic protease [Fulvimarina sp. 2208YS6-2-32]MDY8108460.1 TIGR02281 family clan AA aspartic protease [Fulvimarina sp. 2208YS6-2-32]